MPIVVEISNPFEPFKDTKVHQVTPGITIRGWLETEYPGFIEFNRPTLCLLNGKPLLRKDWVTVQLKDGDIVNFVTLAGFIFYLVFMLLMIAYTIYAINQIPDFDPNGAKADDVYDLTGQRNQIKLGKPIERPYGKNRLYPSLAARSYTKYENNDQIWFALFCLGHGSYQVDQILLEDTPITNFQDVQYEIYEPGQVVTLLPDNVNVSSEVANIELKGGGEPGGGTTFVEVIPAYTNPHWPPITIPAIGYYSDGWFGPFSANNPGTLATRLEVDLILPQGLYQMDDEGKAKKLSIGYRVQYRKISDLGTPVGDWVDFPYPTWGEGEQWYGNPTVNIGFGWFSLAERTPQRFTIGVDVPEGRYEVRAARPDAKLTNTRKINLLHWGQLRAQLKSTGIYPGVTTLAVRARASNNLNDRAANRVNVIATAKIPVWNGIAWVTQATRSPVWAFCDMTRASYGARLDASRLDLDTLLAIDSACYAEGRTFDWVFDNKLGYWEALRIISRAARGTPIMQGSLLTMVRDVPRSIVTAAFGPDNIVENSFRMELKLASPGDYDCTQIEYLDQVSWKQETVLCTLPGGTTDNPDQVLFQGCADRTLAYREGLYREAVKRYQRRFVTFQTGLEGHIPTYGDLVAISHDLPNWGTSGLIVKKIGLVLTLSNEVSFAPGTNVIGIRKRDGSVGGPYTVVAGSGPNEVVLQSAVDDSLFTFGSDTKEWPIFMFGGLTTWAKNCLVVGIQPQEDKVEIRAVVYDPTVYSFDELPVPPENQDRYPPAVPDAPVVSWFSAFPTIDEPSRLDLSWSAALGAKAYQIQWSVDSIKWSTLVREVFDNFYNMDVGEIPDTLYLRVAGVGHSGRLGPWATWSGTVGVAGHRPGSALNFRLKTPFKGTFCELTWDAAPGATHYTLELIYISTIKKIYDITGTFFRFSIEEALQIDNSPPAMLRWRLTPRNSKGTVATTPDDGRSYLEVVNSLPPQVMGVASAYAGDSLYDVAWNDLALVGVTDLKWYKVEITIPYAGTNIYWIPSGYTTFRPLVLSPFTFTIRVRAIDLWGNEGPWSDYLYVDPGYLCENNSGDILVANDSTTIFFTL